MRNKRKMEIKKGKAPLYLPIKLLYSFLDTALKIMRCLRFTMIENRKNKQNKPKIKNKLTIIKKNQIHKRNKAKIKKNNSNNRKNKKIKWKIKS